MSATHRIRSRPLPRPLVNGELGPDAPCPYSFGLLDKFSNMNSESGFSENLTMMAHCTLSLQNKPNARDENIVNFETEMISQICSHLLRNGIPASEIQVLTNCHLMRQIVGLALVDKDPTGVGRIPSRLGPDVMNLNETKDMVRATVVLLALTDNRNERSLYATVLRAIHESRKYVIILCHFGLIVRAHGVMWQRLTSNLFSRRLLKPHLTLKCVAHMKIADGISTPEAFQLASPLGGCDEICRDRSCGHVCSLVCHPSTRDHEKHKEHWCTSPCDLVCSRGHPCIHLCFDKCGCRFKCEFIKPCGHDQEMHKACLVPCKHSMPCGHTCNLKCFQCFNKTHSNCQFMCNRTCKEGHPCTPPHRCYLPCPPCQSFVVEELPCGHRLDRSCTDPPINVSTYKCMEKCNRAYGGCHHQCTKMCHEECGICYRVTYRNSTECGHVIASRCHERFQEVCGEMVAPRFPAKCGHDVRVPCKDRMLKQPEELAKSCSQRCSTKGLACGHPCHGTCSQCFQGRLHLRCNYPCGRTLICGHVCMSPCPVFCPPCSMTCFIECDHFSCLTECGVPCDLVCPEPCTYECPHLKCTLTCAQPCNREGCNEPCPKKLKCGHDCVGFCGETCPPFCRTCSPAELTKGALTGEELNDSTRFLFLVNCGHAVAFPDFDAWIKLEPEQQEIAPKSCPICRIPLSLRGLRRYSTIIMKANEEVNGVKRILFGRLKDIRKLVKGVQTDVEEKFKANQNQVKLSGFGMELLSQVKRSLKSKPLPLEDVSEWGARFQSMHFDKALFIKGVHKLWINAVTRLENRKGFWRQELLDNYESMWVEFFNRIRQRVWPFHPNELRATHIELQRMEDLYLLYNCYARDKDPNILRLADTKEGRLKFADADILIRQWCSYDAVKDQFQEAFKEFCIIQTYTLEISDKERLEILEAFGGRSGRWFKCPKGHVYVVTECGGVTEVGQCNECGSAIGGQNHSVLQGNALASEMDGAQTPLYPTALARLYPP